MHSNVAAPNQKLVQVNRINRQLIPNRQNRPGKSQFQCPVTPGSLHVFPSHIISKWIVSDHITWRENDIHCLHCQTQMIKYLKKIELNYNNYKVNEKKNKRWKKWMNIDLVASKLNSMNYLSISVAQGWTVFLIRLPCTISIFFNNKNTKRDKSEEHIHLVRNEFKTNPFKDMHEFR